MANFTTSGSDTFPTGHVIASNSWIHQSSSHISCSGTTMANTGIAGSITTLKSSANSFLEFMVYFNMQHLNPNAVANSTLCLRASASSTTYATGDSMQDIQNGETYQNYTQYNASSSHFPMTHHYLYLVGTCVPGNLTSYSANETLYWRCFMSEHSSGEFYWFHASSMLIINYREISR